MLFDIHAHCFPDAIAEKALQKLSYASGGVVPSGDGTFPGLCRKMKENGVDGFAVLNIATNAHQMQKVNDFAAYQKQMGAYSFGSVFPDAPDAVDELRRIKELGLYGVKLHPDYQRFFVDDDKMIPIYKEISRLGLCVIFHAGQDFGFPAPYCCTPDRLKRALKHLDCPVIAAHWGGLCMGEQVLTHLCGLPLYFDVSFGYGAKPRIEAMKIVEKHGTSRLLFGSDFPWHTPKDELRFLSTLELSDSETEDICVNNAAKLLGFEKEDLRLPAPSFE